jgi:hypothetical protein
MEPLGSKGPSQEDGKVTQAAKLQKEIDKKTQSALASVDFQPSDAKIDVKEKKWTILSAVSAFLQSIYELVFSAVLFITGRTTGRKVLLHEMQKSPQQLERDILGRGTFSIGKTEYPFDKNATVKETLQKTKEDLKVYIYSVNPSLQVDEELLHELLYASVQNFCMPALGQLMQMYDASVWVGKGQDTTRTTSYKMQKGDAPVLLHIMQESKQNIIHTKDSSQPSKTATILTDIQYNLKTKEVQFHYLCILDGKKLEWTTQNPFKT